MEKRYQDFVSSTYSDLAEERRNVIQTLIEMDCIPSGMELFPALDEEQFEFIKKVIDDCDYYIVIVGGRYGSLTSEGVSYTEKEYDYAHEKGLKVLAFLHEDPDQLPAAKSEMGQEARARLAAFREKLSSGRLVKFWKEPQDLPGLVALNLPKTIKTFPAVGWVRANAVASEQVLADLNELRKENAELKSQIATQEMPIKIDDLASLDEEFTVHGEYEAFSRIYSWKSTLSWKEIFSFVAPYLLRHPNEDVVRYRLRDSLLNRDHIEFAKHQIDDQDFQTITLQLLALGLIRTDYTKSTRGDMALFWSLTPRGEQLMMELRTVRSGSGLVD
jgi:hypothetical protein